MCLIATFLNISKFVKTLRYASYFQLSSGCLEMCLNRVFRVGCNISNTRDSVSSNTRDSVSSNTRDNVSSGYPNTEKRVENTTRSGVFLTKFEVFG